MHGSDAQRLGCPVPDSVSMHTLQAVEVPLKIFQTAAILEVSFAEAHLMGPASDDLCH